MRLYDGGMKVLTATEMRDVDRLTTERYGIPGLLLMENAAARTADAIERTFGPQAGRYVKIVCGVGNNGGDGAAVGRQLWMRGALVDVVLLGRLAATEGDARTNFAIVRSLAEADCGVGFRETETRDDVLGAFADSEPDTYVDAIFGTGLSRPAEGIHADAIECLNSRAAAPLAAIDLPSGLASDHAVPIGPHVRADLTVTFTAPKPACVLPPAVFACGVVETACIGTPDELIAACGSQLSLVTGDGVAEWLAESRRRPDAHKGSAGRVLVVAGSTGKTGAAALASEAVLRGGAGLVTVATPAVVERLVAARAVDEVMTEPIASADDGTFAEAGIPELLALHGRAGATVAGPGVGLSHTAHAVVRALARERVTPLLLDADALTHLAPWPDDVIGDVSRPIVVTPHAAEMARISGTDTESVLADRVASARAFATRHGVITVLKGSRTVVAEPGGEVFVNPTGNSGMATAGSGDVLSGLIGALIGQRPGDPLGATIAGVYLHGLAGDLAVRATGTRALVASDITAHLGRAFVEAGGEAERA